jgi:mannan endo-1,4-beta-mannosidase
MKFAALVAATLVALALMAAVPAGASAQEPIAWGAFTPGAPESRATMEALNDRVGRRAAIWQTYKNFDQEPFPYVTVGTAHEAGGVPFITWEPWSRNLRAIARGDNDGYLRAAARQAKDFGKPILLRFAHEMNGNWYPWGLGQNGNSPADHIAAFRHVVRIFRAEGADNVKHVWSPNVGSFDSLWPGDEFVDYLGLDGYNFGAKYNNWQSFEEIFDSSYRQIVRLSKKPLLITEFSSNERDGDKAAWVRHTFSSEVARRYPQIRAYVWFDENKQADGEADWRVNSSGATLEAFRSVLSRPLFDLDANGLLRLSGASVGDPVPVDPIPPAADHPAPPAEPPASGTLHCGIYPRPALQMSRLWTVNVRIKCDRSAQDGCYGLVKIKHIGTRRTLGTAEVDLWPGRRNPVRIGLPGWARTGLVARMSVRTRITMRVSGGCSAAHARRVTLHR